MAVIGGGLYERLLRKAMFSFGDGDAEAAHARVVHSLAKLGAAAPARKILAKVPRR